ncbi:unnamed protein product [Laminaria digitata]
MGAMRCDEMMCGASCFVSDQNSGDCFSRKLTCHASGPRCDHRSSCACVRGLHASSKIVLLSSYHRCGQVRVARNRIVDFLGQIYGKYRDFDFCGRSLPRRKSESLPYTKPLYSQAQVRWNPRKESSDSSVQVRWNPRKESSDSSVQGTSDFELFSRKKRSLVGVTPLGPRDCDQTTITLVLYFVYQQSTSSVTAQQYG